MSHCRCWDMCSPADSLSWMSSPTTDPPLTHTPGSAGLVHPVVRSGWIICMSLLAREAEQKKGKRGGLAADGRWRERGKKRENLGWWCVCVWEGRVGYSEDYILLSSKWEKKGLFFYLRESTGEIFILILVGIVYRSDTAGPGGDKGSAPSQLYQHGDTRAEMEGAGRGKLIDADLICLNFASRSGAQDLSVALWSSLYKRSCFFFH